MKRMLLLAMLASLLQAGRAQISVIGTATPAGDWDTDYDMVQDAGNPSVYRLNMYLAAGELKFREGHAWTINWGNTNFPAGTAILGGPNIPVTAGFYTITFDTTTLAYLFSSGNVGINNQNPAVSMDIAGALAHRSAHLDVTSMEVTLPPNVSLVKLTGSPPGPVILSSSGGADGQRVILHNATTTEQPVTAFPGAHLIEPNETREFTYVAGEGWQPLSAGLSANNDFWVQDGANDAIRNSNANGFYSTNPATVNTDPGVFPLPLGGAGTRLLWVPEKSAFRVGTVLGARWDADSIGTWSFASGYDTRASGIFSTAMGTESTALGISSTAMGYSTIASGENALALNSETLASGDNAVAMGNFTVASAANSIAMGSETTASGVSSTSAGYLTTASGENAMAINAQTTASGVASFAAGNHSSATGPNAAALGHYTQASGIGSLAAGFFTKSSGLYAIAMGYENEAKGMQTLSLGTGTLAKSYESIALGAFNDSIAGSNTDVWIPTDPLLTLGNGTYHGARSNALTVLKNGNMGIKNANPAVSLDITGALAHRTTDLDVTGMEVDLPANVSLVRLTGSPPGSAFIDGPAAANGQRVVMHNATSSEQPVTAFNADNIIEPGETREFTFVAGEGWQPLSASQAANNNFWVQDGATDAIRNTNSDGFFSKNPTTVTGDPGALPLPIEGAGTRLMWIPEKSSFRAGTVLGTRWDPDSIGTQSIAMGLNPLASDYAAIAIGANAKATGEWATTLGNFTIASGDNSTALGYNTLASGLNSTVLGISNTASGDNSTALGSGTVASGHTSTALGSGTVASGSVSTAIGNLTVASGHTSTALGTSTVAFGDNSTALGFGTFAASAYSVAFGRYNDEIAGSSPDSWVTTDPLLTLGNGTSASNRSNAFVVYKNGDTDIMGFSRFGQTSENAPAIKMKKLTGTGPVTDGTKAIVHGLDAAKILSVSVLMEYGLGPGETIPPKYTTSTGYEYEYQVRTNDIFLLNKAGNSANINERPLRILITYEE